MKDSFLFWDWDWWSLSDHRTELFLDLWRMDGFGEWRVTIVRGFLIARDSDQGEGGWPRKSLTGNFLSTISRKLNLCKFSPTFTLRHKSKVLQFCTRRNHDWHWCSVCTVEAQMKVWDPLESISWDKIWFPPPQTLSDAARDAKISQASKLCWFEITTQPPN